MAIAVVPRGELVHPETANDVVSNLRHDDVSKVSLGEQSHQLQHRAAVFDDREDGIAKRVLQPRPPRVVQFLESRNNARSYLVDQGIIGASERVERHRELAVAGIKRVDIVGAARRNQPQNRSREVAVWVNETDAASRFDVSVNLILKERRLAHSCFADNVKMSATIFLANADDSAVIAKSNLTDGDGPGFSS